MSLFITSLASGSNGNCYYIGNNTEAILVDAGITCKEIETRIKRLSLSIEKIKAIFISHEHADHIRGVPVLAKKYNLPVYITTQTLKNGRLHIDKKLARSFNAFDPISIGDLDITAFPKYHDAADPYSFTIRFKDLKVGVFTDIGQPCQHLINHFSQCHAAFLESNYDDDMLDTGSYPYFLKTRIRGGKGHLSNKQALELFTSHRPDFMSHLFLSHISKNNNCPNLVEQLFNQHAGNTKIIIASRFQETAVYKLSNPAVNISTQLPVTMAIFPVSASQLSFSFDDEMKSA